MKAAVVKACACGLRYTHAGWCALSGAKSFRSGPVRGEQRQCACKSTVVRMWCGKCGAELSPENVWNCPKCSASLAPERGIES